MKLKNIVGKMAILTIAFFSLQACDNDYKEVGADIVGSGNFEARQYDRVAFSAKGEKMVKVQTNLLSSYAIGVHKDAYFGDTKASLVTQFSLSQSDPDFDDNPVLDSVVLNIPFFSTAKSEEDDNQTFSLDSIYGNEPIQLSIYRSGYFLRDFDPLNEFNVQAYYSNDRQKFEDNIVGEPLVVGQTVKPSDKAIVLKNLSTDSVAEPERLSPAIRIQLPVDVFDKLILQKEGEPELSNNDNFQNYFRGLYLDVDGAEGEGFYGLLNFNSEEAGITLYYHNAPEDDEEEVKQYGRFKLNMGHQIINLFEEGGQGQLNKNSNSDLIVKGGVGSVGLIDLFQDPEQLDSLRHANWLVNEANLKLYVDKDKLPADYDLPQRIFVFDVENGRVLKDYTNAQDIKENDILNSRITHLGRLTEDDDGNMFYRIRLTQYVDDILNHGANNTRLGIVVSQNVNEESFVNAELEDGRLIKIPRSSVVARNGVLFLGANDASDQALKFEIFYTETEE